MNKKFSNLHETKKPTCTYVRIIIICILVYNKVSRLQTQIFKKIWEKIILFLQVYINMNWKKITKDKKNAGN